MVAPCRWLLEQVGLYIKVHKHRIMLMFIDNVNAPVPLIQQHPHRKKFTILLDP